MRPTRNQPELGNIGIFAPPRSGKSLLAVSQLLTWQHSVIVNDIKGELYEKTAGYRRTIGKVYKFSPLESLGCRFDPLTGKQTEDEVFKAVDQMLDSPNVAGEKIFLERGKIMGTQMVLGARLEKQAPFPYLRSLIRSGFPSVVKRLQYLNPELATQFLDTTFEDANLDDKFLRHSYSTLTTKLRPLLTENVVRSLSASDFTPEEILFSDTPVSVYFCWRESDLDVLEPLIRLDWGSLMRTMADTYDRVKGRNCHKVLLLIDEAGRSGLPKLPDLSSTIVGRGLSLWVAFQSLSQAASLYGDKKADELMDNLTAQLYYKPASTKTSDFMQDILGYTSNFAHSKTLKEGKETSQGQSEQKVPVKTAWELRHTMKKDDVIGIYRSTDNDLPPFLIKRMNWLEFPELVRRSQMPTPPVPPLPPLNGQLPILPAKDLPGPRQEMEPAEQPAEKITTETTTTEEPTETPIWDMDDHLLNEVTNQEDLKGWTGMNMNKIIRMDFAL